jgi:UDP-glucose 4-epimerase
LKILITGGAGFIGSHLVDSLINLGNNVLVIDNFLTGNYRNLTNHSLLKICEGSIDDILFVNKTFDYFKPDYVVHAAVSYHEPLNHHRDILTNTIGTINIIDASKKYNVKKIINYQTSLCYGIFGSNNPVLPSSPYLSGSYKAGSSYAISKIAAELYIEMSGIPFISFRLANVYGPRNLSGPLPTFFNNILNNKNSKIVNSSRDFIYVEDVVSCTVNALINESSIGFFNIATEKESTILQLYNLIYKMMKPNSIISKNIELSEIGEDDSRTILIDSKSTKFEFNWEPKINLDEGVSKTIEWYKINGISKTFTHLKNIIT